MFVKLKGWLQVWSRQIFKGRYGIVILLVIAAWLGTGCSNAATAKQDADSLNTIDKNGQNTIELKYVDFGPYNPSGITGVSKRWADKINELSNGRVRITTYWNESLVKQVDQYRAVLSGVADICFYSIGISDFYNIRTTHPRFFINRYVLTRK